jgi:hypothetical protein
MRLTAASRRLQSLPRRFVKWKRLSKPCAVSTTRWRHIFVSRRHYRNVHDTKGGKRREMNARLNFNTACELGFRGRLGEWARLRDGDRHDAVIRVYDESDNVIETHEHAGDFKEWCSCSLGSLTDDSTPFAARACSLRAVRSPFAGPQ